MQLILEKIKQAFTGDLPLILNILGQDHPLYFTFIIIVFLAVVQSLILRCLFKGILYKKHIGAAAIMIATSTVVASLLLYSTNKADVLGFYPKASFASMALISAIVGYPFFLFFYKYKSQWQRSLGIIILLNIAAYGALFYSEKAFWAYQFIDLKYSEKRAVLEWSHKEILHGETGYIYMIDLYPSILERFSVVTEKRELLETKSFFSVGSSWNINSGKLTCMLGMGGNSFSIFSLPEFALIKKIEAPPSSPNPDEYHGTFIPKIAPSGESIALIEPLGQVVAQKNRSAYYTYGQKAKIHLCSVKTGKEVYQYPDIVLGDSGFDWSPDSKKIVFVNFRDKSLFAPIEKEMKGNISIGKFNKYPKYLYIYDLDTNSLSELCEGEQPSWSPDGKEILFVKNRAAYIYSFEKRTATELTDQDSYAYKWSPTGKNIICWSTGHLVAINVADPTRKLVIKQNYYGPEFFWSKN